MSLWDQLSAYQLPSSTGTAENDLASAFGGAVQGALTNGLQAVAANYQKVFNPTTGAWQAVSGNATTGGRPDDTDVVSLAAHGGIIDWIGKNQVMAGVLGLVGLVGLGFVARSIFSK